MKSTVYKVLSFPERKSYIHSLRGVITSDCFCLTYPINIEVFPLDGSKIFAFSDLKSAKKLVRNSKRRIVVRAIATNVQPFEFKEIPFPDMLYIDRFKHDWSLIMKGRLFDGNKTPANTVICDSLTCQE